jgi:hypothetical protein
MFPYCNIHKFTWTSSDWQTHTDHILISVQMVLINFRQIWSKQEVKLNFEIYELNIWTKEG